MTSPTTRFNEECRGFTRCGMASMNAVSQRPEAAAGNVTELVDTVVTPNGMWVDTFREYKSSVLS